MKNILVVGGGSAGVMSAYTFKKLFPEKNITILESEDIPTVGVGESTLGRINTWIKMVGLNEKDFIKKCNASLKMSIRFENFYKKGDGGFHYPFGAPFFNHPNDWFMKKALYPETPLSDYAESYYPIMALVNSNKVSTEKFEGYSYDSDVAYHFDATMFANWLKSEFVKIGGVVEKGSVEKFNVNEDGIESIITDKQKKYTADLFIDCTGWKSVLLGGVLKEPFESYSNILPNNKAWAAHLPYTNKQEQLKPYTNCTALTNGWVWNIPLWSRIGTGYVYSDKYISDEEALKEFKTYLNRDDLNFRNLKMRVGLHERIFVKNVCAIGLSAGFIEPLESNGLLSVHVFLCNLVKIIKDRPIISNFLKDQFNTSCYKFFKIFSEFVASHYALSIRNDSEYWKDIQKRHYPMDKSYLKYDSHFQMNNHYNFDRHLYPKYETGMGCIGVGMNFCPTDENILKHDDYGNDLEVLKNKWSDVIQQMEERKQNWKDKIKDCPTLYEHLKQLHDL
jgi:tryptophan halogenase